MEKTISENLTLNNGLQMPRVGLGTYAIKGLDEIVYESIKDGVRLIDTASFYKNEKEVGTGIQKAISEGIVKREEMFVVTKLWIYEKSNPEEAIKRSLENLGLEYIDLYLDHWPHNIYTDPQTEQVVKVPLHILWKNMENLVNKGYTKSIGVSNYNNQNILNLLSFCEIKPVVNQVELHPYLAQEQLHNFCKENNIHLMAYNSICRGVYAKRKGELYLLEEDIIKSMAEKYNTSIGNIALNWALVQDVIVIPGTSNPRRMKENLKSLSFRLSEEDLKEITNRLDKGFRFNTPKAKDFSSCYDIYA